MGAWSRIAGFFKGLFVKAGDFIKKLWTVAEPFLKEVLSASTAAAVKSLQDLAIEAVKQVAIQGLPTDDAKRKAFADYMTKAAMQKGIELGDYELNLLRETAYAIWKKSNEQ
ncbi:MAG: hypothetical protein PHC54_03220 [Candidatus Omnitrophica bacterium]|nr:hypothetical protein [Candidatus Omnitrophota bacterium]MDD5592440.1 hypothetical protein [Candidatus Omnitrophota bacterium]